MVGFSAARKATNIVLAGNVKKPRMFRTRTKDTKSLIQDWVNKALLALYRILRQRKEPELSTYCQGQI